jgi:hypothetical protein
MLAFFAPINAWMSRFTTQGEEHLDDMADQAISSICEDFP